MMSLRRSGRRCRADAVLIRGNIEQARRHAGTKARRGSSKARTREGAVAGLFRPDPDFGDIQPTIQSRLDFAPGQPVIRDVPVSARPGGYPLRPLTEEQRVGLSPADQWIVRDEAGEALTLGFLSLSQQDVLPGPGPMPDACRAHGFEDTVWVLRAH